jgi:ATP-dependent Clp protease adaptor protein ClpS
VREEKKPNTDVLGFFFGALPSYDGNRYVEGSGFWPHQLHAFHSIAKISYMANPKQPSPPNSPPQTGGDDALVLDRVAQRVQPPSLFQVVLLNDDFTPMEFVVFVIQEYFNKDRDTATQIMLKIHLEGKAVCGVFPRDIANTKAEQVSAQARDAGHPLQCVVEPAPEL